MANPEEENANIGINNSLGDSELEILHIMWRRGESTVRQVYDEIRERRNVTLPAVMLSMERLTRRGVIQKLAGNRAAVYRPLVTREGVGYSLLGEVVDKVLRGSARSVVSHLVGRLSKSELEQIATLIKDIQGS